MQYFSLLIQIGVMFGQNFCCIDSVLLGCEMQWSQSTLKHVKDRCIEKEMQTYPFPRRTVLKD